MFLFWIFWMGGGGSVLPGAAAGNRVRAAPALPGAGKVRLGAPNYQQRSPDLLRGTEIPFCSKACIEAPSEGFFLMRNDNPGKGERGTNLTPCVPRVSPG